MGKWGHALGMGWKGASDAERGSRQARRGAGQSLIWIRWPLGSLCLFLPCGTGCTANHAALAKNRDLDCCGERLLKI